MIVVSCSLWKMVAGSDAVMRWMWEGQANVSGFCTLYASCIFGRDRATLFDAIKARAEESATTVQLDMRDLSRRYQGFDTFLPQNGGRFTCSLVRYQLS